MKSYFYVSYDVTFGSGRDRTKFFSAIKEFDRFDKGWYENGYWSKRKDVENYIKWLYKKYSFESLKKHLTVGEIVLSKGEDPDIEVARTIAKSDGGTWSKDRPPVSRTSHSRVTATFSAS